MSGSRSGGTQLAKLQHSIVTCQGGPPLLLVSRRRSLPF
jgi:hypothetical protein